MFGGLTGLFLGFSLVSGFEMSTFFLQIYFFLLINSILSVYVMTLRNLFDYWAKKQKETLVVPFRTVSKPYINPSLYRERS